MLKVFKSNRVENLMNQLILSFELAQTDPMQPDWIGIQSKGMKQWITLHLARHFGICSNVNFVFPRQMVEYILNGFQPISKQTQEKTADHDINADTIFWPIFKQLTSSPDVLKHDSFSQYLQDDFAGKKRFQLACRIASIFDEYQIYRPEMLMEWSSANTAKGLLGHEIWQGELWKGMNLKPDELLFGKIRLFLDQYRQDRLLDDYYPDQMSLFGISAIPRQFLDVFEKISDVMDIHLYLLLPSNQYFFDIRSEAEINKLALKSDRDFDPDLLHFETANPLLASLGKSIQAFSLVLEGYNYQEPGNDLFNDPVNENNVSMLCQIQSDILNLVDRQKGSDASRLMIDSQDRSIQIHSCHSAMRETQVLKDLLLDEFENDRSLSPDDIIVMMPDIESYAPFIESVFSVENALPFAISDRRKRSESDVVQTFIKLLNFSEGRFERSQVMDLLMAESVAQRFRISPDEISLIETMVLESNILWGQNTKHRERMDLPGFDENTWEFGLNRLFMGMVMPENCEGLVEDILPCDVIEGTELETLGKLADFCHTLFSQVNRLNKDRNIQEWCSTLKALTHSMMDSTIQYPEDLAFIFETLDQIQSEAESVQFKELVSFEIMRSLVEQKLDLSVTQGSFMAGKITFCNILPMRSIPFKIVVLMGMDEQSFPRQSFRQGFDLIMKSPMLGDKNQRDEDRYLFLEALLSARSRLIITYTGMNIQDNSFIPCSGVVSELKEMAAQSFLFPQGFNNEYTHPLHPFDYRYFTSSNSQTGQGDPLNLMTSYSKDNLNIAKALSDCDETDFRFVSIDESVTSDSENPEEISLDEILDFFRHPIKVWMHNRLGLKLPQIREPDPEREPFALAGLDQYQMGARLLEQWDRYKALESYEVYSAAGQLPYGHKGELEYSRIRELVDPLTEAVNDHFNQPKLMPLSEYVDLGDIHISGTLPDIRQNGLCIHTFGKINGYRLLDAWIRHLFLNLAGSDDYPKTTVILGRDSDPYKKRPVVRYGFKPLNDKAEPVLEELVKIYIKGQHRPIYFFCETGWQFFKAMETKGFDLSDQTLSWAMSQFKVRTAWQGNPFLPGEREDRYTGLCIENNDPFGSVQSLKESGFVQTVQTVYQTLYNHLQDPS